MVRFLVVFWVLLANPINLFAQIELSVLHTNSQLISIRDGEEYKSNSWRLNPDIKPDVYEVQLTDEKSKHVVFLSDSDSLSFDVSVGDKIDFIIRWNDKDCYQQIIGKRFIPAASFTEEYKNQNKGKTEFKVPPAYEMINVVIAITSFGRTNKNYVYHKSDYFKKVQDYFKPHTNHELVRKLDSILSQNSGYYASHKMNGNAFEFDNDGHLVRSNIYDRTGFRGQKSNNLLPYMELMDSFAKESGFLDFYNENTSFYKSQIQFFTDTANVNEMQNWLSKNFPNVKTYDFFNIIFSPLVAYNQSVTWFSNNGFKELQPHVNFPYRQKMTKIRPISENAENIYRGNIVFTEINHGYINPEADKYEQDIQKAISNRNIWLGKGRSENYYRGMALFNEYMNWGLVTLRIADYTTEEEQEKLIPRVVRMMEGPRGFIMFGEFNDFLLKIYKNRKPNQTLADLYPEIISWFDNINRTNNK